jgi:hypothetical protein
MIVSLHPILEDRSSIASAVWRDGQRHWLLVKNTVLESFRKTPSICISILVCILVTGSPARSQSGPEKRLHSRAQLLTTEAPVSYPEQLVVTASGKTYLLDTDLSTLFIVEKDSSLKRICGADSLSAPSDISVDNKGNMWVLSGAHSKIVKLTPNCQPQTQIVSRQMPLRVATNTFGELIVLNGAGGHLFEIYGPDGKLLREFGQRIDYKDETTNSELSDGRIATDSSGGFFFSFNYPPLIRHYGRNGNLIREFKPESDVPIEPPNVSVRKQGNSMVVRARYQILVLDLAADPRGRLYLLLSGKNKVPALSEGTQKLMVLAHNGRVLGKALLENNFHRLTISNGRLYLLRNRTPFRLDEYPLL